MFGRGDDARRGGWPPRSRARYKKAIPPAVVTLAGLVLMLALPWIPNFGLIFLLGGLSATILSLFLAGLGD